jgi:hypothetical protein
LLQAVGVARPGTNKLFRLITRVKIKKITAVAMSVPSAALYIRSLPAHIGRVEEKSNKNKQLSLLQNKHAAGLDLPQFASSFT